MARLRVGLTIATAVQTLKMDDIVLGQYGKSTDGSKPGYLDDPTVPKGSNCPT